MVAIAGLLAVGIPLIGKMGVGSAIAVAAVVVSSITVLPIFAGALAKRLQPEGPGARRALASASSAGAGASCGARPCRSAIGGIALIILAIPFTSMRLGQPDDGNTPASDTQRAAYDELSEAFGPGFNGPLLLAIDSQDGGELDKAQLETLGRDLAQAPGVARGRARRASTRPATRPRSTVIPTTSPQDAATSDLVDRLRGDVIPAATKGTRLERLRRRPDRRVRGLLGRRSPRGCRCSSRSSSASRSCC